MQLWAKPHEIAKEVATLWDTSGTMNHKDLKNIEMMTISPTSTMCLLTFSAHFGVVSRVPNIGSQHDYHHCEPSISSIRFMMTHG